MMNENELARPHRRVVIRERRGEDLAECVAMLREVHLSDDYPMFWMADPAGWLDLPDPVGAWVAELDSVLVGHLVLVDVHLPDILPGQGALEVKRLFVAPSGRGIGIASGLLTTASRRAGRRPVVLEVVQGTEAVKVYQRLGWQEIVRRRADWMNEPESLEVIWFQAPTRPDFTEPAQPGSV